MRHAEELSITTAPAAANLGANSLEVAAPAENSTISSSVGSAAAASSTTISRPSQTSRLPAERAEANKRMVAIGKRRAARIRRMASPTTPVAPTIPILKFIRCPRIVVTCRSTRGNLSLFDPDYVKSLVDTEREWQQGRSL